MKRTKSRNSQVTISSQISVLHVKEEVVLPPLDELRISIKNLRVTDLERLPYTVVVTFFDQLLLSETIMPIGSKDPDEQNPYYSYLIGGTMSFDPSDYTKMCLFADNPLIVRIQPVVQSGDNMPCTSCCNVDILPLLQGETEMVVSKRMEPMIEPTALGLKSWDNLPVITMKLRIVRHPENSAHHKILATANYMKVTLVAAYNIIVPYDETFEYVAATKIRLGNEETLGVELFKQGIPIPRRFSTTGFYPRWESISWGDMFRKCDEKLCFSLDDIQNDENLDLKHYLGQKNQFNTVFWGSFHRSLLLADDEHLLRRQLRQHLWPLEFQMSNDTNGYSFMGFMDLFKLLYPGETTVRLAVPLQWADSAVMTERCGCDLMLTSNRTPRSTMVSLIGPTKSTTAISGSGRTDVSQQPLPTEADVAPAIVILEVTLARPLIKPAIPPSITALEIENMLGEKTDVKRACTGRGQQSTEWRHTITNTANLLRRLPHFGTSDFCAFCRQLSETRTRVELTTSFWQDAAVYVNNNFVVQDFVYSKETLEEMLMMAHACLVRDASRALVGGEAERDVTLQAARHARQLQDIPHATELYLQLVTENQNIANAWRELSTCLKDKDVDLARVCINEALLLDPRHPLTLLSKGSMLYQEDPYSAELFFTAILALYPFWTSGWVVAQAFYHERQEFHVADKIKQYIYLTHAKGLAHELAPERGWETELGDWWYPTPLIPHTNLYLEAADLLLRLREMPLAEVCLALALSSHGEEPAHSHLVALTCRLRGEVDNALCHISGALETFGEVHYLRSLEAECHKKLKNDDAALTSFEKAGNCVNAYSILSSLPGREPQRARGVVVDLLRRQPSAYAWMALADDWLMRQVATGQAGGGGDAEAEVAMSTCAVACAEQALRWDRRCARAWALLARLSRPASRRAYCRTRAMAASPDNKCPEAEPELSGSQQSLCQRLGVSLKECRCNICEIDHKTDCAHPESRLHKVLATCRSTLFDNDFSVCITTEIPVSSIAGLTLDQFNRYRAYKHLKKMLDYLIAAVIVRWMLRVQRAFENYLTDVPPPENIVFANN